MAERRPRLFLTASLGAALLLVAISVATVVAVIDWKRRHAAAFAHPYDNAQWLVFQGAYEALKLAQLLDPQSPRLDLEAIELRHEIFQSRVTTMTTSAIGRRLLTDPEAQQHIATIRAFAERLDALMQAQDREATLRRPDLQEGLNALLLEFNLVAMRAVHVSAMLRTRDLEALRESQHNVIDLFVIGLCCTLGLFAIVATQLRRLRAERLRAEQVSMAKSAFLATMSHELRTPLNGVIGTLEILADEPLPARSRAHLTAAQRAAEQLLAIIGDVLDMAKLEAGRVTLEAVAFPLERLLGEVRSAFSSIALRKRLTLDTLVDASGRGWFEGDPVRIRQILSNLVSNALKFTEAGGVVIEASARERADRTELILRVSDSGIGIPPEALDRLGRHFEQADSSTTRRYGGTGLGLAIARALAEAMGGGLTIASEPGRGTAVSVTLLLRRAPTLPQPEAGAGAVPKGLRVLVAEDNAVNRMAVTALLERLGAVVMIAEDGLAAVEAASAERFDLILMDVQMPRLDGLDATRRIRAGGGPSARSRIVAVTANAFTEDASRCLAAGMDAHVTKPLRKSALAALLASIGPESVPRAAA